MSVQTVYTDPIRLIHSACNNCWPALMLSWTQDSQLTVLCTGESCLASSLLLVLAAADKGQLLSQALNLSGALGCLCLGFLYCL